ncbi:hypothetical protein ACQP00_20020 [Dactylosporangium sp. CS-047395]|uniref:hypothetical protein n=1 Tax=Dactylosporangium sp. CS-047395 TaxID=3239936 RepID=UPI003D8CAE05
MAVDHPSLAEVNATRRAGGGRIQATRYIASGGEGWVYELADGTALKWYRPKVLNERGAERFAKLTTMVVNPPRDPTANLGHATIAWPTDVVVTPAGEFRGFVMPLLDRSRSVELHRIVNPSDRRSRNREPDWLGAFEDWERLLQTAMNLAGVTAALHDAGYVIGDFNESNVLVDDRALVTVIDCDSMQVPSANGAPFLSLVGKPEYQAPEVTSFKRPRTTQSDGYALAVLIFMLLMEGKHPFAGVWHGVGEKPSPRELAHRGLYFASGDPTLTAPTRTPDTALLPAELQLLFRRAFAEGARNPRTRPTAAEWRTALDGVRRTLTRCQVNRTHSYPGHLTWCPWCRLDAERNSTGSFSTSRSSSTSQSYSTGYSTGSYSTGTYSSPSPTYSVPQPSAPAPTPIAAPADNSVLIMSVVSFAANCCCPIISIVVAVLAMRRARQFGGSELLPKIALGVGIVFTLFLLCSYAVGALNDTGTTGSTP